jgi:predicted RNase H-like nuclease
LFNFDGKLLNKVYLGIDGCKYGWICAQLKNEAVSLTLFGHINEVKNMDSQRIFIDIPIGLGDQFNTRTIDFKLRKLLSKKRKSSVFTPPIREALEAPTYQLGNQINKSISGKGISIQAWNIGHKIKEVNQFLSQNRFYQNKMSESHPELCFELLNNGPLNHSKKTPLGMEERTKIINKYINISFQEIRNFAKECKSDKAKLDDIIDAIVLSLSAMRWEMSGKRQITQEKEKDTFKLPFNIKY